MSNSDEKYLKEKHQETLEQQRRNFLLADSPTPGDAQQFEDIVRAVEILVGNQNSRQAFDIPGEQSQNIHNKDNVLQEMKDNIAVHNETWAVDQILAEEKPRQLELTVLDVIIREVMPDLLKDWMDNNLENIAINLIRREALHDAVSKVWVREMESSSESQ